MHVSFYASLVVEVLGRSKPSDRLLQVHPRSAPRLRSHSDSSTLSHPGLQTLLPFVAFGLRVRTYPDFVSATLVIMAQVGVAAQLVPPVLNAVIDATVETAVSTASQQIRDDALRCVVVICQAQRPASLPAKACKSLVAIPNLCEALVHIGSSGQGNGTDMRPMLQPLFAELIKLCFEAGADDDEVRPQQALAHNFPLSSHS